MEAVSESDSLFSISSSIRPPSEIVRTGILDCGWLRGLTRAPGTTVRKPPPELGHLEDYDFAITPSLSTGSDSSFDSASLLPENWSSRNRGNERESESPKHAVRDRTSTARDNLFDRAAEIDSLLADDVSRNFVIAAVALLVSYWIHLLTPSLRPGGCICTL